LRLLGGLFGLALAALFAGLAFHLFTPFAPLVGGHHHLLPQ
jgi:hypothetical protein